jgi:2-polyprenyl-6-hydroxyphenyl methylase/3-demethylubiquinone-9 3-methyltransferase
VTADPFALPGWWEGRAYASLRAVNELRLQVLGDWQRAWFEGRGPRRVVDFGCGGGLMALPLAAGGARVLAVDRSLPALQQGAAQHSRQEPGGDAQLAPARVVFALADLLHPPVADRTADLALLCDVLEHVDEPERAVAAAARTLRAGGYLFVHTINRTLRARVLAIWLGEGLGLIPRGTHEARRFVRPRELERWAASAGLSACAWCGERPRLWASLRARAVAVTRGRSLAVGYCAAFQRRT